MITSFVMTTPPKPSFSEVLAKAGELQRIVPGAVLVGGSAAAFHAGHRHSIDHAHVITDLDDRFDSILDHLEALGDWSLARAQPVPVVPSHGCTVSARRRCGGPAAPSRI